MNYSKLKYVLGEVRVFQHSISIEGNRKVINCRYFQNLPLIAANFGGIAMKAGYYREREREKKNREKQREIVRMKLFN